jgi:hypothetical protein
MLEEGLNTTLVASFDITLLKIINLESVCILNVERNVLIYLMPIYLNSKSP